MKFIETSMGLLNIDYMINLHKPIYEENTAKFCLVMVDGDLMFTGDHISIKKEYDRIFNILVMATRK